MNNKFVMAAAQKWLRDLLLMLDLGKHRNLTCKAFAKEALLRRVFKLMLAR